MDDITDYEFATAALRLGLCGEDRMEKVSGEQHSNHFHSDRYERSQRQRQRVANLGWNNVKATAPIFVGDTL
jgi:acyl dehydratase